MTEEINKIKDKIMHPNATTIAIRRVPKDTAELFKKLANDRFVGDYGMALKWLCDNAMAEAERMQRLYTVLEDHEHRLAKLENAEPMKFKIHKTISGKEIKIPIKEQMR